MGDYCNLPPAAENAFRLRASIATVFGLTFVVSIATVLSSMIVVPIGTVFSASAVGSLS